MRTAIWTDVLVREIRRITAVFSPLRTKGWL
jgi:hypothetical protein